MIGQHDTGVFYYAQPVDSADEAVSLAEYLNQHGILAYQSDSETHAVEVPVQCATEAQVSERCSDIYSLVKTWRLFWEHSDKGLFGLPIYQKD